MKVHTTGGYLTHVACGYKHAYGVEDGDVMGCVADIGWAVGHGVNFYGNLLNGGTALLFESLPNFPDPGRYWQMVEKHKITQFFSAPTAYRNWYHELKGATTFKYEYLFFIVLCKIVTLACHCLYQRKECSCNMIVRGSTNMIYLH